MSDLRPTVSALDRPAHNSGSKWPPSLFSFVAAGLVGALLGWGCMKAVYPIFVVPEDVAILPDPPPIAAIEKLEAYQFVVDNKNYSLVYAAVGACIGACTAFSIFGARGILATVLTAASGGMAAALGAILCNIVVTHTRSIGGNDIHLIGLALDSMAQAIIAQGALWGLLGLGVGLGLGLFAKGIPTGVKGGFCGMVGGAIGTTLYLLVSAYALPISSSNHVTPKSTFEQIAIMLTASFFICAVIALTAGDNSSDSPLNADEVTHA